LGADLIKKLLCSLMDLPLLIKGREKKGDESLKSITKSTDRLANRTSGPDSKGKKKLQQKIFK